jgi:hypothetical protein
VNAPAEQNRATKALIEVLRDALGLKRSQIAHLKRPFRSATKYNSTQRALDLESCFTALNLRDDTWANVLAEDRPLALGGWRMSRGRDSEAEPSNAAAIGREGQ